MLHHHAWRYGNILLLVVSIFLAAAIVHTATFHAWILNLGAFRYLGALIAGVFFTSMFTVLPSTVVLIDLSATLSPWQVGLVGALGATAGNFFIFHVVRSHVSKEVELLTNLATLKRRHSHLWHILHTKYFNWTLLVLGAIVIASPLPDDLGISLLGLTKIKTYQLLLLSFFSNAVVIFFLATAARSVRF